MDLGALTIAMQGPFLSQSWHRVADLEPRLKPHIEIHAHRYRGRIWYVLQDHVTGRVHRFTPAAYFIIGRLDGGETLDQIWTEAAVRLEAEAPSQDEVIHLLYQLHSADVLDSGSGINMDDLTARHRRRRRSEMQKRFMNPLSFPIRLFDPDPILRPIAACVSRVPPPLFITAWLALVLPALLLGLLHAGEFRDNLSDQLISAENLLLIAIVYPFAKLVHELGHALAARVLGIAVHDIGFMFITFYPMPYVDASGTVALKSKYDRAFVAAAGMLAEAVLAALALYIWLAAEPGFIRAAAFSTILIASVSTLVVNGNPFLRFDGYYILSDLVEIPNLGQRSNRYWGWLVERYAFGATSLPHERPRGSERIWLVVYAPIAFVYRLAILIGISLFVAKAYPAIGLLFAVWSIFLGVVLPIVKLFRHVVSGSRLARHRKRAIGVTAGALVSVTALFLAVPAPLHTVSQGIIWLPDEAHLRPGTSGFLVRLLRSPGAQVLPGDAVAELDDPALRYRLRAQKERVREIETRLVAEKFGNQAKAALVRKELAEQLIEQDRLSRQVDRLVLRSKTAGTLYLPGADNLIDRFFREGEDLGYVTPEGNNRIRAVVIQDDVELVRRRLDSVSVRLAGDPSKTYAAHLVREVPQAIDRLPSSILSISGGGLFTTDPRDPEGLKTLERVFQVELSLSQTPTGAGFGERAIVRFNHFWEPLGYQIYRRVRQVFLAKLDV